MGLLSRLADPAGLRQQVHDDFQSIIDCADSPVNKLAAQGCPLTKLPITARRAVVLQQEVEFAVRYDHYYGTLPQALMAGFVTGTNWDEFMEILLRKFENLCCVDGGVCHEICMHGFDAALATLTDPDFRDALSFLDVDDSVRLFFYEHSS